jgi:hypothetical protein
MIVLEWFTDGNSSSPYVFAGQMQGIAVDVLEVADKTKFTPRSSITRYGSLRVPTVWGF